MWNSREIRRKKLEAKSSWYSSTVQCTWKLAQQSQRLPQWLVADLCNKESLCHKPVWHWSSFIPKIYYKTKQNWFPYLANTVDGQKPQNIQKPLQINILFIESGKTLQFHIILSWTLSLMLLSFKNVFKHWGYRNSAINFLNEFFWQCLLARVVLSLPLSFLCFCFQGLSCTVRWSRLARHKNCYSRNFANFCLCKKDYLYTILMLFFMRIKNLQLYKPFEVQPSYSIKLLLILKYPFVSFYY